MPEMKRKDFVEGSLIGSMLCVGSAVCGYIFEFSVLDLFSNPPEGINEKWAFYITEAFLIIMAWLSIGSYIKDRKLLKSSSSKTMKVSESKKQVMDDHYNIDV